MTGASPLRLFGLSMLAAVALFVLAGAAVWAYFAEPWYDNTLTDHMNDRAYSWRERNDTHRIAPIFPAGMSGDAALTLLRRNGFACSPPNLAPNAATVMSCLRKVSSMVCGASYTITILFDNATIKGVTAVSQRECL